MQMEKYLDLYKKFLRLKSDERLFLKLYCPEYKFLTLNAIGKVVEFYPEKTFRFWKHTIKNKNYYGVIKVEYSALGQVNFN